MKQTIMLITDSELRLTLLVECLTEAGFDIIARFKTSDDLVLRTKEIHPDLIVIDLEFPDRKILIQLQALNESNPKPIVIVTKKGKGTIIKDVINAGVSTFVIDGLVTDKIKATADIALTRFKEHLAQQSQIKDAQLSVEDKQTVDQAKKIIMKQQKISEHLAFTALKKMASNQHLQIPEAAKNVISAAELLT